MQAPPLWDDYLIPDETILWQGQPRGGILWHDAATKRDTSGALLLFLAAGWLADLPARLIDPLAEPTRSSFPRLALVCVVLGLGLILWRLWADARLRARTWYALTDRAALTLTERGGTRHLMRCTNAQMRRLELVDGNPGTLWFGQVNASDARGGVVAGRSRRLGFRHIDDARRVWDLMAPHRKEIDG